MITLKSLIVSLVIFFKTVLFVVTDDLRYLPSWDSIDSRPLPQWYDEAKVGIFIHWGVYSVPGFHSEWFWYNLLTERRPNDVTNYTASNYPPNFKYADFANDFKAFFFDPYKWAEIFNKSGANKHHEGFTMWPSPYSWNWNSVDIGPKRDIVDELSNAMKQYEHIKFGLYYSLYEWYHPLYIKDRGSNFTTQEYVEKVSHPQIMELVNKYKPEILWLDGDAGPPEYWKSLDILAWLYNESPVKDSIVTNDRWGTGCVCHHGGYYTCDDRFIPNTTMKHKWENCMTLDVRSWGYRRNMDMSDVMSFEDLLLTLLKTISLGGNILINVGPTSDGVIPAIFEERLLQLGKWLEVNGDAIYATNACSFAQSESFQNIWYTCKKHRPTNISSLHTNNNDNLTTLTINVMFMNWPESNDVNQSTLLTLSSLTGLLQTAKSTQKETKISFLSIDQSIPLEWNISNNMTYIDLGKVPIMPIAHLKAWTIQITIFDFQSGNPNSPNHVIDNNNNLIETNYI